MDVRQAVTVLDQRRLRGPVHDALVPLTAEEELAATIIGAHTRYAFRMVSERLMPRMAEALREFAHSLEHSSYGLMLLEREAKR